ncbi:DNA mismatch repair protein MutS [Candidatus Woesearchaeota archaeon]|nr:DNA mismatch repair protein MutS [Candidatus Woesearchaeota archaeon]
MPLEENYDNEDSNSTQTELNFQGSSSHSRYFEDLDEEILTPGMKQYINIKKDYPDFIVMFRMGDFYEMFYEDAKIAAESLDIVLTSRGKGEKQAPLAGIPFHSIDPYIAKLIKQGFKVVIAEQVEDPKLAKGLVKREVTRIITPGTITEQNMLDDKTNNYIVSISQEGKNYGIGISDVSTGEFYGAYASNLDELNRLLSKFQPSEIIVSYELDARPEFNSAIKSTKSYINAFDERFFKKANATDILNRHFLRDEGRKSFNDLLLELGRIHDRKFYDVTLSACGALLSYLKKTQMDSLSFLSRIELYRDESRLVLDHMTIRNLELLKNITDGTERGSLVSILDKTATSPGARLLRKAITMPLMNVNEIDQRLDAVEELIRSPLAKARIRDTLKQMNDIERLVSRIGTKRCSPRDVLGLKNTLILVPRLNSLLSEFKSKLLQPFFFTRDLEALSEVISHAIKNEPPSHLRDGNVIKKGFNEELDRLTNIKYNAREFILKIEEEEKEKTGIKSLKIKFNRVFGYFIEIQNASLDLVPKEYIRKQTMSNCERYITEDLKQKEFEILDADDKIKALEEKIFFDIVSMINKQSSELQEISKRIATVDFLQSLSTVGIENDYVRPVVIQEGNINIINGRHPVVEKLENNFISNDCNINEFEMMILTGPNMAGKSTYLRQNALIILLAQLGSFVPATSAHIGLVDRIFTRVGAYDDLSTGQSTFMVEMNECSHIIKNATSKSLIVLDEVGRGTSTFDGVSIAWSLAEYIYNKIRAKTLFATHYHVLNKLADSFKGIHNYNMSVDEDNNKIVFLRKVIKGGTDKSYGIHVARLAGLPFEIINRANEIQEILIKEDEMMKKIKAQRISEQKTLFDL